MASRGWGLSIAVIPAFSHQSWQCSPLVSIRDHVVSVPLPARYITNVLYTERQCKTPLQSIESRHNPCQIREWASKQVISKTT